MTTGGFIHRNDVGVVEVTGKDTWSFLQNLVSQDLDPLVDGAGAHSLLLDPKGRILSEFRILRVGDAAWLVTANSPGLTETLSRYRIRVDVDITDRSGESSLLSVRGGDATVAAVDALGTSVPSDDHAHASVPGFEGSRAIRLTWAGEPGLDILGPENDLAAIRARLVDRNVPALDDETFERLRVETGVPRLGVDFDESTLPHEVLLDRDAVSFTKGCFLGQEIVGRIDARGRAPKLLRRIEIPDGSTTVPGAGSEVHDGDGKTLGTLTSVATRDGGGAVGLAILPVAVEPPADVTVDGVPARALAID